MLAKTISADGSPTEGSSFLGFWILGHQDPAALNPKP